MSSRTPITSAGAPHADERREAGPGAAEPGPGGAEGPPIRRTIDDRALAVALIPLFGLAISSATGLFAGLGPADPAWWWGRAWFVGGSAAIYLSNRALLFAGRAHADWFSRPVARLVLLATGIVFGTVPPTLLMLHGWAWLAGAPVPGDTVVQVGLVNVICVLFVTWLYETLFLIRERVDDQVRVSRIAAARTQAELDLLRAQVDPHFLFNALNTLAALVDARPADARRFIDDLARVYRRLLDSRGRTLVPLAEELELASSYAALLEVRFGDAFTVRISGAEGEARGWHVPPGAAQVLLENAVRHNAIDPDAPLVVEVDVDARAGALCVAHPRRPRRPNPGVGQGLANLRARVLATTGRPLEVEAGDVFRVVVPLVAA